MLLKSVDAYIKDLFMLQGPIVDVTRSSAIYKKKTQQTFRPAQKLGKTDVRWEGV